MTLTAKQVARLRADTPGCAERIHLNNAGAGLMPKSVSDAIHQHLELESRIGGYEAADAEEDAIRAAYGAVAGFIGCEPRNVAFVENATVAYAQVLSSIPFERGDRILTSTDDYISNQIMFLSLARRLGVEIVRAPNMPGGGVDVDAMNEVVRRDRPRLVALTHVPTNSGLVQPVREVGEVCRDAEVWYLVDACQSVGQLPVEVGEIGCDFLSVTARKFLRGPRGCGFLFASDRVLDAGLEPLFIDMRGAAWTDADAYAPYDSAARFENWEFAYALVLGTGEAVRYAAAIGMDMIAKRTTDLAGLTRRKLQDAGLRTLDRGSQQCGIVTVEIPNWKGPAYHAELQRRGINTAVSTRAYAVIDFDDKGVDWVLRVSPHYYNTEEEIESAVSTIAELAASRTLS